MSDDDDEREHLTEVPDAKDSPGQGPDHRIERVWLFVASDPETGAEGLLGINRLIRGIPHLMPMLATCERARDALREEAIKIGRKRRQQVRLLTFGTREFLEVVYSPPEAKTS
jgi:hypothetical protein